MPVEWKETHMFGCCALAKMISHRPISMVRIELTFRQWVAAAAWIAMSGASLRGQEIEYDVGCVFGWRGT